MKPIMLDNQILLPSYLSTSLRQKIEKVCICLHVPPSMLPLPPER
ncbi:hypothetical protein HU200_013695 [Digitaria exilis]|uniref:Uncharacterized protein n=1 Tax=Digitaria exilis TaxID=1010633 RepID=A0A835FCU6_9POAL|nr:hypothetical protein HU200_013695 [Digitaria exilis]